MLLVWIGAVVIWDSTNAARPKKFSTAVSRIIWESTALISVTSVKLEFTKATVQLHQNQKEKSFQMQLRDCLKMPPDQLPNTAPVSTGLSKFLNHLEIFVYISEIN